MEFSASELTDDELRRLTDGELFCPSPLDMVACRCGMRFVSNDHLIDLCTSLAEACVSDQKQEAFYGLRDVFRCRRDKIEPEQES
jgi:hypothetical protein